MASLCYHIELYGNISLKYLLKYLFLCCLCSSDANINKNIWQVNVNSQTGATNSWNQAKVPIPATSKDYLIVMEALYGGSSQQTGGTGFDDVSFSDSSCACKWILILQ